MLYWLVVLRKYDEAFAALAAPNPSLCLWPTASRGSHPSDCGEARGTTTHHDEGPLIPLLLVLLLLL